MPTPGDADAWQQLDSLTFAVLKGLVRNETRAERRRGFLWLKVASAEDTSVEAPEAMGMDAPAWFRDLPAADQQVLALLAEGYTAGEIAGIVDSTPAAVNKRISRARHRIRDLTRAAGGAADA